jgi:hypothetical protein
MLAAQSGDDAWLRVRPPLSLLEPAEEQAVRQACRELGTSFHNA